MAVKKESMGPGKITSKDVLVPLTVPKSRKRIYVDNYLKITRGTGRLFLFAADHKIEHLNKDFWRLNISCTGSCPDVPDHLFKIASKGSIGAFCTQLGLISRMGAGYPEVDYVVKMNSKTDIVPTAAGDPYSKSLCTIDDVIRLRNEYGLKIRGVGYTIYLGSSFEHNMLTEGARVVLDAHKNGLVAILWVYPRGLYIKDERDEDIVAGAAGVGAALGADFVKVRLPRADTPKLSAVRLRQATKCAGSTGVICAGGKLRSVRSLLMLLEKEISLGGTRGFAIGRNIYQRSLDDAIKICDAVMGITTGSLSLKEAIELTANIKP